nr:dna mismatch repair protein mlh3 [Quercus suber]
MSGRPGIHRSAAVPVMSRILPMSPEAISHIQSSKEITSLSQVVIALLENSLDATATRIDINVDFNRASCTVDDNGHGIMPVEFTETGGLGRAYHTSKADRFDCQHYHGGTGTSLASITATALVRVTSYHGNRGDKNVIAFHNGKIVSRQLQEQQRDSQAVFALQGTQIEVRDLFGNMPVRVKQRAIETGGRHRSEKLWTELKRSVASFLLPWPRPCTVKLSTPNGADGTLRSVSIHSGSSFALTHHNLNQFDGLPTRTDPRDALRMLYEARLAIGETRFHWVPLSATAGALSVRGAICRKSVPTRQCQFLSIGIHPCSPSGTHNELYETVNRAFLSSSFGVADGSSEIPNDQTDSKGRPKHNTLKTTDIHPVKQSIGRRSIDKWPMFVLQINLGDQAQHRQLAAKTSNADLGTLVEILQASVEQWLTANQFQPQKQKRRKLTGRTKLPPVADDRGATVPIPPHVRTANNRLTPPFQEVLAASGHSEIGKQDSENISAMTKSLARLGEYHPARGFSAWSRVKSSRNMIIDNGTTKRPSTTPAKTSMSEQPKRTSFVVPVVEAGQFNSHDFAEGTKRVLPDSKLSQYMTSDGDMPSSDNYGCVDESAMCDIAASADIGCEPNLDASDDAKGIAGARTSHHFGCCDDKYLNWVDPVTGEIFQINSRTGIVLSKRPSGIDTTARHAAPINTSLALTQRLKNCKCSVAGCEHVQGIGQKEPWLPEFLRQWENPVFQRRSEAPIPVVTACDPVIDWTDSHSDISHVVSLCEVHNAEDKFHTSQRLSKALLRNMKVIAQVDRKFILCKITRNTSNAGETSLVIVDQHAASERVILESLLAELCTAIDFSTPAANLVTNLGQRSTVTTILLDKHLQFDISETEYHLSIRHAKFFAQWGILYDAICWSHEFANTRGKLRGYRILVRALPPGISNRCALTPSLFIELLRSELWRLADSSQPLMPASLTAKEANIRSLPWIKRLGSCPKGIIEMLNSRACRSAIMFNDTLDIHQCEDLLRDLGKCAFPFVCAHGRTSMVPLVDFSGRLDHVDKETTSHNDRIKGSGVRNECFSEAFKFWQKII